MFNTVVVLIISIVITFGILIGLYFAVRSLIYYTAKLKKKKNQIQEELEKMNIDDLN